MRSRVLATATALATEGVERNAAGEPTAFRIWRAGPNVTDYGTHVFSAQSAELLMSEQETRGNLYSIDVDHMSLNEAAPPEARKAVGWHALEVRAGQGGPELWATQVEWTEAVRAGLTASPPEWRYFSPAYDVKDGEIVSYLNTALTNNPATHFVTALASRVASTPSRGRQMDKAKLAALMAALFGEDEEKEKEAKASLASMSKEDREQCTAAIAAAMAGEKPADDDKAKKEEAARAAKASEDEENKKKEEAARAARVQASADVAKTIGDQDRRLVELEKRDADRERARIMATRPDLTKKQLEYLDKQPVEDLEDLLALIPAPPPDPAAAARVAATRGDSQTGGAGAGGAIRASRSSAPEAKAIAERFGRNTERRTVHWEGSKLVFPLLEREEAAAIIDRHRKAGPLPRGATLRPETVMAAARAAKPEVHQ